MQSPHAHASIKGYDLKAALALPGVRAIVTGDDLDPAHRVGAFIKDEPALAKGKVRYVGEIVAAVAADTEEIARRAARLVRVDYEPLPAVLDPAAALEPGARWCTTTPRATSGSSTPAPPATCSRTSLREGDPAQRLGAVRRGRRRHLPHPGAGAPVVGACGALAEVDAQGRVTLWSANQSVFRVQANVCESLGLPMTRLRCQTPRVGAGFGNKMEAHGSRRWSSWR